MFSGISNRLARFGHDATGSIAIIFALTAMIIFVICGMAIDVGRAVHAKSKLHSAIDAAALAAAKGLRLQNLTQAQAIALAKEMFARNFNTGSGAPADVKSVNVVIDPATYKVEVTVDAEVKTTLGKLAGINVIPTPRSSTAIFEAKDLEVAVQLDVTGSMSGQKIRDLKDATGTLVDIMLPDGGTAGQKVRVGFVPFASGVNAGRFAVSMIDGAALPDSCLYERLDGYYQKTDDFPAGRARLKSKADLGSARNCPAASIVPLSDDKHLLKSTVATYGASGTTAGHLGTAFSWYLLSPKWSSIWPTAAQPASYADTNTIKVAILMTDGQYNTFGGQTGGSRSESSAQAAIDTCTEMKRKGIAVYTVGFMLRQRRAKEVMADCATSTSHAYLAEDGAALKQTFRDIAEGLMRLRLSK